MSNIPILTIPSVSYPFAHSNRITITADEGNVFTIYSDGKMTLEGSKRECARCLATYILKFEYSPGMTKWIFNDIIKVDLIADEFFLTCMLPLEPDFFEELAREFNSVANRMFKMKVFW